MPVDESAAQKENAIQMVVEPKLTLIVTKRNLNYRLVV